MCADMERALQRRQENSEIMSLRLAPTHAHMSTQPVSTQGKASSVRLPLAVRHRQEGEAPDLLVCTDKKARLQTSTDGLDSCQ
jgi:hypothetical protein